MFILSTLAVVDVGVVPVTKARTTKGKPPAGYCTITYPANGLSVSGVVTITIDASSTPNIYVDGVFIVQAYTYDWDTTAYADGSHKIKAEVSKKDKDSITVNVNNGGGSGSGDKFALVIGIEDYEGEANDLTWCVEDAIDWKNYLVDEGYEVTMLLDAQATYVGVLAGLQWLANVEGPHDSVVITYSGHGWYDNKKKESTWFVQDLQDVYESEIAAITSTFESQRVYFFDDACNQGTMRDLAMLGWVMAIGSNEHSYTYDGTNKEQNGIFTWFAMQAIYDQGYFTAEEISQYAIIEFHNFYKDTKPFMIDQYEGLLDL